MTLTIELQHDDSQQWTPLYPVKGFHAFPKGVTRRVAPRVKQPVKTNSFFCARGGRHGKRRESELIVYRKLILLSQPNPSSAYEWPEASFVPFCRHENNTTTWRQKMMKLLHPEKDVQDETLESWKGYFRARQSTLMMRSRWNDTSRHQHLALLVDQGARELLRQFMSCEVRGGGWSRWMLGASENNTSSSFSQSATVQ